MGEEAADRVAVASAVVLARARRLHQGGVDAMEAGHPVTAARQLRAGLRLLGWPGRAGSPLTARLLISLAFVEAELGRTAHGLGLLAAAEPVTAPADRGVLVQQRGLLLLRTGRSEAALRELDAALPLLEAA